MFKNKILMITGGTGSFGNAVLDRFIGTDIQEIRIFSRDEKKQDDMRHKINSDRVKYYIGDVRDFDSINKAMHGVDYVFHAAALKQVPSCEFYPMQALKTNVIGTENVLNAAILNKIKKVIVLSTDKAVYPINVMGMTKALSEKVMVARSRDVGTAETLLCATRYGNVMASRGSVIPLFVNQIFKGEPITITDPDMTRFIMSLEEAVELVLYAYKNATQGDIFIQKAPAATIEVLAQALLKLFNVKNEIRIIGTRHGEKKYETLVNREELANSEDLGDYLRIKSDSRDLNYNKYFVEGENQLSIEKDYTSHNTKRLSVAEVIEKLKTLDFIQKVLKQL
jgi:UDP-N-acetylglucosamine 4,6-dehydratase/5-epimerase